MANSTMQQCQWYDQLSLPTFSNWRMSLFTGTGLRLPCSMWQSLMKPVRVLNSQLKKWMTRTVMEESQWWFQWLSGVCAWFEVFEEHEVPCLRWQSSTHCLDESHKQEVFGTPSMVLCCGLHRLGHKGKNWTCHANDAWHEQVSPKPTLNIQCIS